MKRIKLFAYLLTLLLATVQASQNSDKNLDIKSNEQSDTSSTYIHGQQQDWNKIIDDINKNKDKILQHALIQLYKDGIARPHQHIKTTPPVYFIVGPSGSGKSTSIFALQGNKVDKKPPKRFTSSDEDETASDTGDPNSMHNNTGPLILKKTIYKHLTTPKVAASSYGVTEGVKIYYTGKKKEIQTPMAFCDTEGFLGKRKVNNNADKLIASFAPYFAFKANTIGGIVFVVSTPDINAARGRNFLTCMHFLKKYFDLAMTNHKLKTLKQSVMLLITKEKGEEMGTAVTLANIIQQAYQDYYKKRSNNNRNELKNNQKPKHPKQELGQLKPFFSLFLKKDIAEHEINTIDYKFLDKNNVRFFYPYELKSVKRIRKKLLGLKILPHDYLSLQDNPISQYLIDKIIHRAFTINNISHQVLQDNNLAQLQSLLQQKDNNRLQQLSQVLQQRKKQLSKHNYDIRHSSKLECVYHDRHIEETPLNREEEKNKKILNYKQKLEKEIKQGTGYFSDSNMFKRSINRNINRLLKLHRMSYFEDQAHQAYIYAGYLSKHFVYTGGAPIYTIEIRVENHGDIDYIKPDYNFIQQNFEKDNFTEEERLKTTFKTSNQQGIKQGLWHIYHETDYEHDANCSIKLFSNKSVLQASQWKIEDNNRNIQRIDLLKNILKNAPLNKEMIHKPLITNHQVKKQLAWCYLTNRSVRQVLESKALHISPKRNIKTSNKEPMNVYAFKEEMNMINCWSNRIFKHNSTNQELITQYIANYNEAVSDEYKILLQDDNNDQKIHPLSQDNTNTKHSDNQPGEQPTLQDNQSDVMSVIDDKKFSNQEVKQDTDNPRPFSQTKNTNNKRGGNQISLQLKSNIKNDKEQKEENNNNQNTIINVIEDENFWHEIKSKNDEDHNKSGNTSKTTLTTSMSVNQPGLQLHLQDDKERKEDDSNTPDNQGISSPNLSSSIPLSITALLASLLAKQN